MALPEKDYFRLDELKQRWNMPFEDIRYYIEHGQLAVQVWLDEKIVRIYKRIITPDGEEEWLRKQVTTVKGYVFLEGTEARKVFREERAAIRKFKALDGADYYKIENQKDACRIGVDDLMVARGERDRFEAANNIRALNDPSGAAPSSSAPSFPGRPSVMRQIMAEFARRAGAGLACNTLAEESAMLHQWAVQYLDKAQVPTARTIGNALRHEFKRAQGRRSAA